MTVKKKKMGKGARMAQLVKCLTLDFSSDHIIRVVRLSPMLDSKPSVESAWDSFPPPSCSVPPIPPPTPCFPSNK